MIPNVVMENNSPSTEAPYATYLNIFFKVGAFGSTVGGGSSTVTKMGNGSKRTGVATGVATGLPTGVATGVATGVRCS